MFVSLKIKMEVGKPSVPEESVLIKTALGSIFPLKKFLMPCQMKVGTLQSFT